MNFTLEYHRDSYAEPGSAQVTLVTTQSFVLEHQAGLVVETATGARGWTRAFVIGERRGQREVLVVWVHTLDSTWPAGGELLRVGGEIELLNNESRAPLVNSARPRVVTGVWCGGDTLATGGDWARWQLSQPKSDVACAVLLDPSRRQVMAAWELDSADDKPKVRLVACSPDIIL